MHLGQFYKVVDEEVNLGPQSVQIADEGSVEQILGRNLHLALVDSLDRLNDFKHVLLFEVLQNVFNRVHLSYLRQGNVELCLQIDSRLLSKTGGSLLFEGSLKFVKLSKVCLMPCHLWLSEVLVYESPCFCLITLVSAKLGFFEYSYLFLSLQRF